MIDSSGQLGSNAKWIVSHRKRRGECSCIFSGLYPCARHLTFRKIDELSPNLGCDIIWLSMRLDQILVTMTLFEGQREHLECQIPTKKHSIIYWMNGWIQPSLKHWYIMGQKNKVINFGDLDFIFKVISGLRMSNFAKKGLSAPYSTALGFFQFPTHPSGADLFALCNPTQGSTQILPVILWYSPCDPPANGWNHRGYKILILSIQVKQGKVHRILITPLQSHSKLHWKIPVFSLQCFHRNGWSHRGVIFFNPSTQFYYPLGWGGNWKNSPAVLYLVNKDWIETQLHAYKWEDNTSFNFVGLDHVFKVTGTLWLVKFWPNTL